MQEVSPLPTPGDRDDTTAAAEHVCAILKLLQVSSHGVPLNTIAQRSGLDEPTASHYLSILRTEGYAEQDISTKMFRVGPSLIRIWPHFLKQLRERARPHLEAARHEFGETVSLGVLESDAVVLADVAECDHWLRVTLTPGSHLPLHSTAVGKAIAAHLPEDRVQAILTQAGMLGTTNNTTTTVNAYVVALAKVRDLGYALDEQEHDPYISSVAAPILGPHPPAAAISMSAPADRLSRKEVAKIGERLREIAGHIAGEPIPA